MRRAAWATAGILLATASCSTAAGQDLELAVAVKEADYFTIGSGSVDGPAIRSTLTGPHYEVTLRNVVVAGELPGSAARHMGVGDGRVRAADGYELVIVSLTPGRGSWAGNGVSTGPEAPAEAGDSELAAVSVTVDIAGREERLPQVPESPVRIAMSVPISEPVFLRVNDAGRTQSLNLRDGTLGPDVHPGIGQVKQAVLNLKYRNSATVSSAATKRLPLEVLAGADAAALHPWTPETGWSRDDRRWLYLSGVFVGVDENALDRAEQAFTPEYRADIEKTFTLILPGGGQVKPASHSWSEHSLVFDVPATFAAAKLRISPDGQVGVSPRHTDIEKPASWAKRPAVQEFSIVLT